jgi:hypothetical protein
MRLSLYWHYITNHINLSYNGTGDTVTVNVFNGSVVGGGGPTVQLAGLHLG